MSGVLDRMAKRALGALPTVEPRSTPLFAPSAIGFTGAEIAALGSEEVFAEAENSRSNVDNSQRKKPRLPLEASERQSAGSEKSELQPMRESAPRSLSANFATREREGSSRHVEAHQEANSRRATERIVAKNGSNVEETVEPEGSSAQRRTVQAEFAEAEMNNVIGAERSDAPRGPIATSTITSASLKWKRTQPAAIRSRCLARLPCISSYQKESQPAKMPLLLCSKRPPNRRQRFISPSEALNCAPRARKPARRPPHSAHGLHWKIFCAVSRREADERLSGSRRRECGA